MKFIFRGHTVFEYVPDREGDKVVQHKLHFTIPMFDYCRMVNEDYKLLAQFFDTVYRHTQGEMVDLKDIKVN